MLIKTASLAALASTATFFLTLMYLGSEVDIIYFFDKDSKNIEFFKRNKP